MRRYILFFIAILANNLCRADPQANSFTNIYANVCLKNLYKLDELRTKLKEVPALPAEKAEFFLQGKPGSAWPVPDKNGVFIVAIPDGQNFCTVYAQRVNAESAEQQFMRIVEAAPDPLTAQKTGDDRRQTPKNGPTRTVSYEWSTPKAPAKMLFTLTTATGENADLQGMASAAIVK